MPTEQLEVSQRHIDRAKATMARSDYPIWPADAERNIAQAFARFEREILDTRRGGEELRSAISVAIDQLTGLHSEKIGQIIEAVRPWLASSTPTASDTPSPSASVSSEGEADDPIMGKRSEAERDFLVRVDAWAAERQPTMDTPAGHKKREAREREAGVRLLQAAALLAWHMRHGAASTTSPSDVIEECARVAERLLYHPHPDLNEGEQAWNDAACRIATDIRQLASEKGQQ